MLGMYPASKELRQDIRSGKVRVGDTLGPWRIEDQDGVEDFGIRKRERILERELRYARAWRMFTMLGLWAGGVAAVAVGTDAGFWTFLYAAILAVILGSAHWLIVAAADTRMGRRFLSLWDTPDALQLGRDDLPPVLVLTDRARDASRLARLLAAADQQDE